MTLKNEFDSLKKFFIDNKNKSDEKKKLCYEAIKQLYIKTFNGELLSQQYDAAGFTLLHWAALCCQPDEIERLVTQDKVDVNIRSKKNKEYCQHNFTPLYIAAIYSNVETVQCLIDKKADFTIEPINTFYYDGLMNGVYSERMGSAFEAAKYRNDPAIIKILELPVLKQYISERAKDNRAYKRYFTLFGHTFNFGFCRRDKLSAAQKLESILTTEDNPEKLKNALINLKKSDPGVAQGNLGKIYRSALDLRK